MSLAEPAERSACDVLVIGAGAAGLTAAIAAARSGMVILASRTLLEGSSSYRAQGGVAAAVDEDDTLELHAQDTIRTGRGLCRVSAVDRLVRDAPRCVDELRRFGVQFDSDAGLEGGHSRRRVRRVGGAETGPAIVAALTRHAARQERIGLATDERVASLWVRDGRCVGAHTNRRAITARATILATGGYAGLWKATTNPPESQGDGLLLAFAAGAPVADLEFVQFHPTVFQGRWLLSEALRGEGALLLDTRGERFTDELAPRDEVARAVAARGGAWLDLRPVDVARFPGTVAMLQRAGYDPEREPIPVAPAAHYTIGGVVSDLDGRTAVPGLYAVGECACTGVHGANRLASNSLLECLVFGRSAGLAAPEEPPLPAAVPATTDTSLPVVTAQLREAVERYAGLVRNAAGLRVLGDVPHPLVRLVANASLLRRESRGVHFRDDAPKEDVAHLGHYVFRNEGPPRLEHWQ